MRGAVLAIAIACAAAQVSALEVSQLEVSHDKQRFSVEAVAHIDVPIATAFDILTDYAHLSLLDPQVLESRLLERPEPNVALVWMRVRGCVVFICRELEQVERIEEHAPSEITLNVLPERSDVKYETAQWRLEAVANGTRLHYMLAVEPGPWVPFFAHGSVERKLRASFLGALGAIEKIAAAREEPS